MIALLPYHAEVVMDRKPIANWVVMYVTVMVSVYGFATPSWTLRGMVLDGWSLPGILTYMFLHIGVWHLLGNMLFLFVFGNAVCAKIGNLWYPLVFCAAGVVAAVAHLLFSDGRAVGASGAINGIVGIFLVYYPVNQIRCWWCFIIGAGDSSVSSMLVILYFFAYDLLGAFFFDDGVAYAAHIGGFVFGVALGALLLHYGIRPTTRYERSLFDLMQGRMT